MLCCHCCRYVLDIGNKRSPPSTAGKAVQQARAEQFKQPEDQPGVSYALVFVELYQDDPRMTHGAAGEKRVLPMGVHVLADARRIIQDKDGDGVADAVSGKKLTPEEAERAKYGLPLANIPCSSPSVPQPYHERRIIVSFNMRVPAGKYILVPSLSEANKEAGFCLRVYCDHDIALKLSDSSVPTTPAALSTTADSDEVTMADLNASFAQSNTLKSGRGGSLASSVPASGHRAVAGFCKLGFDDDVMFSKTQIGQTDSGASNPTVDSRPSTARRSKSKRGKSKGKGKSRSKSRPRGPDDTIRSSASAESASQDLRQARQLALTARRERGDENRAAAAVRRERRMQQLYEDRDRLFRERKARRNRQSSLPTAGDSKEQREEAIRAKMERLHAERDRLFRARKRSAGSNEPTKQPGQSTAAPAKPPHQHISGSSGMHEHSATHGAGHASPRQARSDDGGGKTGPAVMTIPAVAGQRPGLSTQQGDAQRRAALRKRLEAVARDRDELFRQRKQHRQSKSAPGSPRSGAGKRGLSKTVGGRTRAGDGITSNPILMPKTARRADDNGNTPRERRERIQTRDEEWKADRDKLFRDRRARKSRTTPDSARPATPASNRPLQPGTSRQPSSPSRGTTLLHNRTNSDPSSVPAAYRNDGEILVSVLAARYLDPPATLSETFSSGIKWRARISAFGESAALLSDESAGDTHVETLFRKAASSQGDTAAKVLQSELRSLSRDYARPNDKAGSSLANNLDLILDGDYVVWGRTGGGEGVFGYNGSAVQSSARDRPRMQLKLFAQESSLKSVVEVGTGVVPLTHVLQRPFELVSRWEPVFAVAEDDSGSGMAYVGEVLIGMCFAYGEFAGAAGSPIDETERFVQPPRANTQPKVPPLKPQQRPESPAHTIGGELPTPVPPSTAPTGPRPLHAGRTIGSEVQPRRSASGSDMPAKLDLQLPQSAPPDLTQWQNDQVTPVVFTGGHGFVFRELSGQAEGYLTHRTMMLAQRTGGATLSDEFLSTVKSVTGAAGDGTQVGAPPAATEVWNYRRAWGQVTVRERTEPYQLLFEVRLPDVRVKTARVIEWQDVHQLLVLHRALQEGAGLGGGMTSASVIDPSATFRSTVTGRTQQLGPEDLLGDALLVDYESGFGAFEAQAPPAGDPAIDASMRRWLTDGTLPSRKMLIGWLLERMLVQRADVPSSAPATSRNGTLQMQVDQITSLLLTAELYTACDMAAQEQPPTPAVFDSPSETPLASSGRRDRQPRPSASGDARSAVHALRQSRSELPEPELDQSLLAQTKPRLAPILRPTTAPELPSLSASQSQANISQRLPRAQYDAPSHTAREVGPSASRSRYRDPDWEAMRRRSRVVSVSARSGWEQCEDPQTGFVFYFNPSELRGTWHVEDTYEPVVAGLTERVTGHGRTSTGWLPELANATTPGSAAFADTNRLRNSQSFSALPQSPSAMGSSANIARAVAASGSGSAVGVGGERTRWGGTTRTGTFSGIGNTNPVAVDGSAAAWAAASQSFTRSQRSREAAVKDQERRAVQNMQQQRAHEQRSRAAKAHREQKVAKQEADASKLVVQATRVLEQQKKADIVKSMRESKRLSTSKYPFKAMGVRTPKGPMLGPGPLPPPAAERPKPEGNTVWTADGRRTTRSAESDEDVEDDLAGAGSNEWDERGQQGSASDGDYSDDEDGKRHRDTPRSGFRQSEPTRPTQLAVSRRAPRSSRRPASASAPAPTPRQLTEADKKLVVKVMVKLRKYATTRAGVDLRRPFQKFDKDNSRMLDAKELSEGLQSLGINVGT